jgi:NhaP-type Na+/H+ or K+/H+ antiporter
VSVSAIAVFAVVVVAYVSQSHRLERLHLTAPIVFSAVGAAFGLAVARGGAEPSFVRGLAEGTLALVLFHDAAQVQPRQLRREAGLCTRLLLLGLPLTILAGFGTARLLFPGAGVWLALLLAAALAPTDAGLGAATVLHPAVPARVRRVLNVESGLNDGLATPVVLFAIAAVATPADDEAVLEVSALKELSIGLLVGVVLGTVCGLLLSWAFHRRLVEVDLLPVAALAVPLLTYYGSVALHGNGFVAAFVSGTAFAAAVVSPATRPHRNGAEDAGPAEPDRPAVLQFVEWTSVILGYAVWALFGIVAVAHLGQVFTWPGLVFAVLSLTVLRMVPVALVLLGTGLRRRSVLFIGWFGPRGLASVVFALLAVESLPVGTGLEAVIGAIATTVMLSVVLHGVTADPWARAYGRWIAAERPAVELAGSVEPVAGRGSPHGRSRGQAGEQRPQ